MQNPKFTPSYFWYEGPGISLIQDGVIQASIDLARLKHLNGGDSLKHPRGSIFNLDKALLLITSAAHSAIRVSNKQSCRTPAAFYDVEDESKRRLTLWLNTWHSQMPLVGCSAFTYASHSGGGKTVSCGHGHVQELQPIRQAPKAMNFIHEKMAAPCYFSTIISTMPFLHIHGLRNITNSVHHLPKTPHIDGQI